MFLSVWCFEHQGVYTHKGPCRQRARRAIPFLLHSELPYAHLRKPIGVFFSVSLVWKKRWCFRLIVRPLGSFISFRYNFGMHLRNQLASTGINLCSRPHWDPNWLQRLNVRLRQHDPQQRHQHLGPFNLLHQTILKSAVVQTPYTGVGKCPMTWVYWTSPYSSHLVDHIPNGWVMFNGDMTNDPCYIILYS